ncbi:MAG: Sec-independent protein translocase protein TatB [Gammaproteobacteria bacterium]
MSGIGFWELVVLFVIGLLILGPERLPRVATQIGRWVGKARRTANQLRYQIEREIALADIEKKTKDRDEPKREAESSAKPDREQADDGQGETRPQSAEAGESDAETPASAPSGNETGSEDQKSS